MGNEKIFYGQCFAFLWAMFSIAMSYIICGYEPWEQRLLAIEFWLTGEKYFPNWEKISRQVFYPDGYALCIRFHNK